MRTLLLIAVAPLCAQTVPGDLGAFLRETGALMQTDRAKGQRALNAASTALLSRAQEGEDRLYAGFLFVRTRRYDAAVERLEAYLAGKPANRELALAGLIEAGSWDEKRYGIARRAYETYFREFASSRTADPLRGAAPLRLAVEESMARVALLSGEDNAGALRHYDRALEAIAASPAGSVPVADLFRLRWWRSDSVAALGRLDEAIGYLIETRPLVKSDAKSALDLEDRIVFKQTDKFMQERKYKEARAMLEARLPEFVSDNILHRRVSKLLDRMKLVDGPAPEFAEGSWIAGGPHSVKALRGRVVLLEFLTSG